jgi:hypothetical protein
MMMITMMIIIIKGGREGVTPTFGGDGAGEGVLAVSKGGGRGGQELAHYLEALRENSLARPQLRVRFAGGPVCRAVAIEKGGRPSRNIVAPNQMKHGEECTWPGHRR